MNLLGYLWSELDLPHSKHLLGTTNLTNNRPLSQVPDRGVRTQIALQKGERRLRADPAGVLVRAVR